MKRFSLLIVSLAILCVLSMSTVTAFAEETETAFDENTEVITETTKEANSADFGGIENEVDTETATETETPAEGGNTLLTRLQEAWNNGDIMDIAVIAWGVVCSLFMFVLKNADKVNSLDIRADVNRNAKSTTEKMNELVTAHNTVTDTLKEIGDAFKSLRKETNEAIDAVKLSDDKQIQDLSAKIDACGNAVIAFASMMQTIYSNSKTIPQSTKDIVNEDYIKVIHAFKSTEGKDE